MTNIDNMPDELSRIMHHAIIGQGRTSRTPTVEQIADEMGVRPLMIYKWLEGENALTFGAFCGLYRILRAHDGIGPIQAMRYIAAQCDPGITIGHIKNISEPNGAIDDDMRRIVIRTGEIATRLDEALTDGCITDLEVNRIAESLDRTRSALDGMQKELTEGPAVRKTKLGTHIVRMPA